MSEHLPYFFTEPARIGDTEIVLEGADAHHLQVRRARAGDHVQIGDGRGSIYQARLQTLTPTQVKARILGVRHFPKPDPEVTVFQGLAKGSKIGWVVAKLVELGVDEVVIFVSGRSVPLWDEQKSAVMLARWQRIALAASKQSLRPWLPGLRGPVGQEEAALAVSGLGRAVVGDPTAEASLRRALEAESSSGVGLIVGPEGGLGAGEIARFQSAGAIPASMGSSILRTETAGFALACATMFHLGRFG